MPSSHLILCHPLLLLPPIPPSIRVFSSESTLCMRWPKYWSFSFSISPSSEHPGLISFRMDWLDLLAVQGTLKSLPQHHSSKASILRCSAFFTVQLSHPYMTTGKNIALTRWTFVGKVMSLLFNILSAAAAKSLQSCLTLQPHRWQPTRLPHPWDSPGKSPGVGCHCILQCMKVKSESEVAQLCLTLCNPVDCSPPGSSAHGILQARILEWVAISFSRGPSQPRDRPRSPTLQADTLTSEPPGKYNSNCMFSFANELLLFPHCLPNCSRASAWQIQPQSTLYYHCLPLFSTTS